MSDCTWTEDVDGVWDTTCGERHMFIDQGPKDNKYWYCPYCGRPLYEALAALDDPRYIDHSVDADKMVLPLLLKGCTTKLREPGEGET